MTASLALAVAGGENAFQQIINAAIPIGPYQLHWLEHRKARAAASTAPAIVPRWATTRERIVILGGWLGGTVLAHQVFVWLWHAAPNPFWEPQWWFYWSDAWIFVGSMLATYMMARGWNEFWIAWIAVDLVGVPLGSATGYVPTAVMYIFYGLFVLYGLSRWIKATREETTVPEPDRLETQPS